MSAIAGSPTLATSIGSTSASFISELTLSTQRGYWPDQHVDGCFQGRIQPVDATH
jgi:hypothetical protein